MVKTAINHEPIQNFYSKNTALTMVCRYKLQYIFSPCVEMCFEAFISFCGFYIAGGQDRLRSHDLN